MSLPVFDKVRNSIEALDEKTRERLVKQVRNMNKTTRWVNI